jgi:hypothetical protein
MRQPRRCLHASGAAAGTEASAVCVAGRAPRHASAGCKALQQIGTQIGFGFEAD